MRGFSILREAQYRRLRRVRLDGEVLDLGGSTRSGYHDLFAGSPRFTVANIDASYGCDLVFDAQETFPLEDASFDHVVAMNLLEHLAEPWNAVAESSRVLKSGGTFVGATPFMHHVHGSPDDYYRYTGSALAHGFGRHGFVAETIEPLGDGIVSLIFQSASDAMPRFLHGPGKAAALLTDRVLGIVPGYRRLRARIPLGYFFIMRKR